MAGGGAPGGGEVASMKAGNFTTLHLKFSQHMPIE